MAFLLGREWGWHRLRLHEEDSVHGSAKLSPVQQSHRHGHNLLGLGGGARRRAAAHGEVGGHGSFSEEGLFFLFLG